MSALSSIESEFETTEEAEDHDQWFRAKALSSLAEQRPNVPHDEAMRRINAIIAAAESQSP
jgi:hypothetical protein